MNQLTLNILQATKDNPICIDNFTFTDATIIDMAVDGISIRAMDELQDALVVLDELEHSLMANGRYLIFTSVIGIADDGGWDGVDVTHRDGMVHWHFDTQAGVVSWCFDAQQYRDAITQMLAKELSNLEPVALIFPESWEKGGRFRHWVKFLGRYSN